MTIRELREAMRGLDPNMKVYLQDHDHQEWETSGPASSTRVVDQSDDDIQKSMERYSYGEYAKEHVRVNTVKEPYFVISN